MDVTLVLPSCRDITDDTLEPALDHLFSDDSPTAELSFLGGELSVDVDLMRRAIASAQRRAEAQDRTLLLHCTVSATRVGPDEIAFIKATGMRVTLSIDGAPLADDVQASVQALLKASVVPEASLVITPLAALSTFPTVRWLWSEGVRKVRASLARNGDWSAADKSDLHDALVEVGRQLIWHRLRGEEVVFQPFDDPPPVSLAGGPRSRRVVIGLGGELSPSVPLIAEERGGAPPSSARWFARLCADIGDATAAALADVQLMA